METDPTRHLHPDLASYARLLQLEAEPTARDVVDMARESHERRAARDSRTSTEIEHQWSEVWDYYDAVVFAVQQDGLLMLERSANTSDDHAKVRDALLLLHCSFCLTLQEIRTLLRAGYWTGAAARWRALHEVTVTAVLVAHEGHAIAERYLDHGFVVQTNRLVHYKEGHDRGPVSREELERRKARSDELVRTHTLPDQKGSFAQSYGWAAPLLPVGKKGTRIPPTFDELEKLADLADLRLLVASAHGLVHNDSAGVVTSVLMDPGEWALGPVPKFTSTVLRPTLLSTIHCVAATHLGFEPALNQFSKEIGLFSAAVTTIARWGLDACDRVAESQKGDPDGRPK